MHRTSFLALAVGAGLSLACLIDSSDDSGTEAGTATSAAGSGTAGASGSTASASGSGTAASTAADETAAGGVCGWGPTGDPAVPEGYVCGGEGEDPSGNVAMECPAGVDLQVGGGCGGVEGEGCCDTQGNAWFCGDAGEGPALARLEC